MYSVHTGTYHFMTLKYVPGTYFFPRVCPQKHTIFDQFEPGTYRYIPEKKVCTEYILRVKSMYQVQTSLCPFISVPYYSMVHTGMYRYELGSSSANQVAIMSDYVNFALLYVLCQYYVILCHYYINYLSCTFWTIMSDYVKQLLYQLCQTIISIMSFWFNYTYYIN